MTGKIWLSSVFPLLVQIEFTIKGVITNSCTGWDCCKINLLVFFSGPSVMTTGSETSEGSDWLYSHVNDMASLLRGLQGTPEALEMNSNYYFLFFYSSPVQSRSLLRSRKPLLNTKKMFFSRNSVVFNKNSFKPEL